MKFRSAICKWQKIYQFVVSSSKYQNSMSYHKYPSSFRYPQIIKSSGLFACSKKMTKFGGPRCRVCGRQSARINNSPLTDQAGSSPPSQPNT